MAAEKRKRGRPIGTGIDDTPVLRAMAVKIAAQPALKPTTAFFKVTKSDNPSYRRRIQIKWKLHGHRLLVEIKAQRAPVAKASAATQELALLKTMREASRTQARMQDMLGIGDTFSRALREMTDSPMLRAERELEKYLRLTASVESPTDRLLREMRNSPTERLMREMRRLGSWPY